jgi:EAL domain-containing protein (putative c-di-GMP-specific phosphodiesterase class I)
MWNYDLVIPELVIISTFLVFYFTQPRLPIRLHKSFLFILIIDVTTLFVDVGCTASLEYLDNVPPFVYRLTNTIYFFLFVQRIMCFTMFTNIILAKDLRFTKRRIIFYLIPFIAMNLVVLSNLFVDSIFCISETGEYSQGPLYNLIYVCAYYYIALCLFYTVVNRKRLTRGEFVPIIAHNIVLLAGYSMRILFPTYLLMNFFTLITIIVIYLSFENPTLFIEEKSGAFNKKALLILLREIKPDRQPLILGFTIHNYSELREIYSYTQTDKGLSLIGDYLKKTFPNLLPFYLHDGRFVLLGKNLEEADLIRAYIMQRFEAPWKTDDDIDMLLEIAFTQVKPELLACDRSVLFNTLLTTLAELDPASPAHQYIDFDDIAKNEMNMHIKRAVEIAVEQNSVELFLQPVIDAKTRKLTGAESLARLRDPNGDYIPPPQFIPVAEKNGRINELGEQMFEKTCQFIKSHDLKAMGLSWINVNLSPIQFLRRDLDKRFTAILKKYDIPPEFIHLEITEESMIDFDLLESQMCKMKASGFVFVLDDYGRGYSNIARMKKCPFINVKLDMEFVWDFFKEKDKILPTLVQTIKQMGFTVTAEGIETQEIADAMSDIGCDYLQGFVFSKPIPADEFAGIYGKN